MDRSTVVRWETGTVSPQPWMRPRLADALRITVEELVDLLTNEAKGDGPARRGQDAAFVDSATQVTAADLRDTFDELVSRYDQAPSASLLAKGGEHLSLITDMARNAPAGRAGRELLTLQADVLAFMGQLVWDASQRRDHATARLYYDESLRVARHLHDPTLEARARLRTSYVALYGAKDPRTGLDLALQAAETARPTSPAVTGLSLLHAGEAYAMLGRARECEAALAAARQQLERTDGMDAAADLISPTQFGRLAGSCYLSLGEHRRAEELLQATAAQLQDRRKSRAIVLGNLTLAYIRQGEVDAAVAALTEAIAEVRETRGGGGLNVVFNAARELSPWRQERIVADVHDQLFALMATA
ncbi:hypothetical protein RKD23_001020 [Streptomyces sp. SAI-170]